MQHHHDRVSFEVNWEWILAAAGSAVGLGSMYLAIPIRGRQSRWCSFHSYIFRMYIIFGLPIMVAEFTIGRSAKASTGGSFSVLAPGTKWKWVGYLGVLTGFLILGYYSVVAG